MLYLKNNTILQELYIPRQEYISVTTGSSGTYAEGYADGVNDQKAKLSSSAFTENGEYERENGWSAITVNVEPSLEEINVVISADTTTITPSSGYDGFSAVTVDATEYGQENYDSGFDDGYTDGYSSGSSEGYDSGYTEGYDSGSTDGFNSGYTSGETHQKSLLVSTAITENGSYQRENGYSAITVNVPNTSVLGNGSFTANGYYSASMDNLDGYSFVTVNVPKDEVTWIDLDYEMAFKDIKIMPLYYNVDYLRNVHISCNDMVNSARTDGQNDIISTFTAATATTNGVYGSRANPLSSITVNVPKTGTSATLGDGSFSANGTYSASTDNLDGYSAITINVPTSGGSVKYLEYIETNGTQIGWDTGYNIGTDIDAKIYLDFMPISGNGYGDYWFAYYGDCAENVLFRRPGNNGSIGFRFGNNRRSIDGSPYYVVDGNRYLISLDKNGITDENTGTLLVATSSRSINSTKNLYLNCEGLSGNNQVYRCIRARYYSFRVENGNGETTLDMRPCLDGNNVPCFYDEISQTYIYHIGSGTPIAGPISDPSYQSGYTSGYTDGYDSGYTEGYNSGYTEGQNDVISTFSSITITQNGHYGSYAHPMTSITVNVPTSGGSGYSIDQLAIRDYNINNPTINTTDIKLFAFANSNLSGMLTIGSAVTNIYAYAFSYTNISGITFPQTIVGNEYGKMVMAGSGQFEGCANLISVNIPSYIEFTDNARARNIYGIFEECRNLVSVNWDADRVPTDCFKYCSSLSAINLTNVTNIDNYSFMNCGSLSSITIPSVCTRIGNGAFCNCSSLNEINVLATTAPTLGVVAFTNTSTGTVHYPQGSDYSSWQSNTDLSGWTFIADL